MSAQKRQVADCLRRVGKLCLAAGMLMDCLTLAQAAGLGEWDVTVVHGELSSWSEDERTSRFTLQMFQRELVTSSTSPAPAREIQQPAPQKAAPAADATLADRYCANIADAAKAAWLDAQMRTLADSEKQLEARIKVLETKTEEHKAWLGKREEFERRASDGLVKIYGRMRPDAAAAQLQSLDDVTAAALLFRLDPKISSQLMAEMEAPRAARLSTVMAGAAGFVTAPRVEAKKEPVR